MHKPKIILLKAHVPWDAVRTLLIQNGWTWQGNYPRVNLGVSALYFVRNKISADYYVNHDLGVHYLYLQQQDNDANGDDLQAAEDKLKANLATWTLHELHENLRSANLFERIEALHILVLCAVLEKKTDAAMFNTVKQFMHDDNKVLRVIANRLCLFPVEQYTDEILELARQRIIEDTELEDMWQHLAETIEERNKEDGRA